MRERRIHNQAAFSLVELLTVIAVTATLLAMLTPSLAKARKQACAIVCLSNTRQLGLSFMCYGLDYNNFAMPNYDPPTNTYWWGQLSASGIDHELGYVWPYLQSNLQEKSVYECPSQKFGSYRLQGKPPFMPAGPEWITSTYGYNGYYLCPPQSPWLNIRHRPWKKITDVPSPDQVIAFGDAMLDWDISPDTSDLSNTALIDPPFILDAGGSSWIENVSPTTSFRHNQKANILFVDGHCEPMDIDGGTYTSPEVFIGSIKGRNAPHYVPDFEAWTVGNGRRRRN